VFEALGGFDPRFVVYLEDADLAVRAARAGWETWFLPCDPIAHRHGWQTGNDRPWRIAQSWRSLWRYGWKHFSRPGAAVTAAVVTLVAPTARLAYALSRGSWRDAGDSVRAYVTFWRLLSKRQNTAPVTRSPQPTSLPPG
jgi:N-acetylglucosaminyl-diphospho-decaprenol L-rhamnosyltransferase